MSIDYSVGYATSSSPFGPWKKNPNSPIIHRSLAGENGSGHGDVFKGMDGKYYYVYHVHNSDSTVQPRKTRIVPLILEKGIDGVYSITIDKERVIKPIEDNHPISLKTFPVNLCCDTRNLLTV
jgi:beta-xylosidase